MKNTLVQIGDVKQLQKVCLTPVDENNRLLKEPPTSWDAIKTGNFIIINTQHSITASQELQAGGCSEPRRSELQMWDAYIVWTLDEAKLRNISSFSNCTNHLNHAKPTWGNQMISYRKIWKICGRPTEKENEGVVRGNAENFNVAMHKVRCSIQAGIVASTIPGSLSCFKILYLPVPCRTCKTVIFRLCEALILTPGTLYFSQKFIVAVVQRFQNINPDSDGAHIKGPRDLKNEIQIITLPTELWTSWKTFLNKHIEGELINSDTDKMFKEDRKFKLKQQTLKREFFKHYGHFTNRNFGVLAQHLIGATPGRTLLYPKVSVARTRYLVPSKHSHADWVERRKRKKVILQDFMALNPDLHFTDEGGDVIDNVWRQWKQRHRFTTTSWDFLLLALKADYFQRRLQNEAWSKRITEM